MTAHQIDGAPRADPADAADPAVLAELLAARLAEVLGADVRVVDLRRLTGGASRETWSFTAEPADGAPRRLVLRRDPPGFGRPEGMALEAAAIGATGAAGVAVPRLVDSGTDPAVVGAPYLITEHVDGETIARRLLREDRYAGARAGLAAELGATLARIHALPLEQVPGLPRIEPLEHLRASYDALGEPLPTIEIALHWLAEHRPEPVAETVVHGDFRTGNLIIAEDGLRAVLDWEIVHRGDPREDLGWLCVKCWRFGSPLPAGGFGTVEQLLDGYAAVAGWRPAEADVLWWQVYGTARWAVGCRAMAERHLSGQSRSVELAAIGRRVCEQEHDVLLALGLPAEPTGEPTGEALPWSDLHGRPTSPELVAAVAEFLRTEVMAATDGRLNFLSRVAANALDGVERELRLGPEQAGRQRRRLAALARADQAGLAAAIRSGALAADDPAVLAAVRAAVTDRLAVANPRYLQQPG
ncbi:phosphotransferase family protein [Pseudonocardia lacus]|uniref:phosphotransferase family protein n=1 Tax=Pseudonocardia lacus TaxID=2835865 RepID=UPI001BDC444A|nr:phosphotransferase family protein [Pseudonocardia lacus]